MKKYNALQILTKVYGHTLKAVPFSGVSGILNYLVQGMFPAVTSLILARLFDEAYLLTRGVIKYKRLLNQNKYKRATA